MREGLPQAQTRFMAHGLRLPGGRPLKLLLAGLATSSCGDWLYNVALLPYRVIDNPPWSKVIYSPSGGIDWSNVEQSGVIFQERNE